jgi:hypothetical protein
MRVGEASNPGPTDWDIPRPLAEVLKLEGTVASELDPYAAGYPPLIGVIMPDKTRRLFVAPHHPLEGGRVITMMRAGRSVSADFVDSDLTNWLHNKVGNVLTIESFGSYQSGNLAIMDWDAMEHLTNLPSWMYARPTNVADLGPDGHRQASASE